MMMKKKLQTLQPKKGTGIVKNSMIHILRKY